MDPTNTTMLSIQIGNEAAEITAAHNTMTGIIGKFVPWANLNYAVSPAPAPSPWTTVPEDPKLEARGWLSYAKIWPQDRPLPPGTLWRTTTLWDRGTWPPPPGEELGLIMAPMREWISTIPEAPTNPTVRYVVNFATKRIHGNQTAIFPYFMGQSTERTEPRLSVFATGLDTRNPVCITEDPFHALALGARGYRAIAVGNYASRRKQGPLGKYIVSEVISLLMKLSSGAITVYREPSTRAAGLERIINELRTPPKARIDVKEIPETWPEFTEEI